MAQQEFLVPGTWILSVKGEINDLPEDDDEYRSTGPNAIGTVTESYTLGNEVFHSTWFNSGVWVHIQLSPDHQILYPD